MENYFEAPKPKLIYVFRICDAAHNGCLKVGETTFNVDEDVNPLEIKPNSSILNAAARKRIDQYTQTAGIAYELLYTECTMFMRGLRLTWFNDKDVHEVLRRSGIKRKIFDGTSKQGREWFVTDLETVKKAIAAIKVGRKALTASEVTQNQSPIELRPEQRKAVDMAKKRYAKYPVMLWNAKMRFGKTLSALQLVKEMGFGRTLLYTHRPDVIEGWFEDFNKIFYDRPDYQFGSKVEVGSDLESLEHRHKKDGINYVYFASLQDLRGSKIVGGKFEKNDDVFSTPWDFIIIDEAHEGTQTPIGKAVFDELTKHSPKRLELTGTAFNLLDNFSEDEVFTWDYTMEQRAKEEWDQNHFGDPNPYAGLPRMNIYTYDLGRLMGDFSDEDIAFNFREFFRTSETDESFVHEADVKNFLNLLSKEDAESMYPFANQRYRNIFKHTLWMLPGVKAAKALSALLKVHPVFGKYDIVNVAGDGDEEEDHEKALKKVKKAIAECTYGTITLSCGRLTTGVSVPQWMGVLMLSGSFNTAASAYMQTIFRVQTPYTVNGLVKEDCYVFDFAPDRTLQVLATVPRVSTKAGKTTEHQKRALAEFLNFCPVIGMEGSKMKPYDANKMMEQLKKAYVERVVRNGFEDGYLYNDELMKLSDVDVQDFDNLKGIIGQTKAIGSSGDIDVNSQGLTNEEYGEKDDLEKKKKKKQLTDEEKARLEELKKKKKVRDDAISILRGISIRMPLLIYGADIKEEDEEDALSIHNFTTLVDAQSWEEFMPKGVTKQIFNRFKKYYDEDIFTASAKRIRQMARAADRLTIEERIERITAIFRTFRNPDKETVLTPWHIVNRHMSDTLGGYCFFDEHFDKESTLEDPRFVERKPTNEVFASNSRLLEINSKSGLYPLYLAYNLYRTALKEAMFSPQTLDEHLRIWDKVVAENIFVICKTPMAKAITRRTLVGFRSDAKVNTRYFEDLINQIKNKPENFLAKVVKGKSFWKANNDDNMKFKAVVGNPPYQEVVAQKESANGQKRSSSIFHHFQTVSDKLGAYSSLIYPGARWIHRSGKGLEQFGLAQINDSHLMMVEFFPDSTDIFESVGIADGLSIVLKDMRKETPGFKYIYSKNGEVQVVDADNPGESLLPLNPRDSQIVDNIDTFVNEHNLAYLHDAVLSQKLFSIESDFVENNPDKVREYDGDHLFDQFNPETEIKLLTNDKAGKAGRARWYIADRSVITTGVEHINRWKVIVSSANAGGQKRSNQIAIADNHSAFGRSRVALRSFETEAEANNFFKYCRSELIRFAFLLTDESLTSLAKKVPDLMDYTDNNGFIDFSGDINAQLYELFHIDDPEQEHIRAVLATKAE